MTDQGGLHYDSVWSAVSWGASNTTTEPHIIAATFSADSKEPVLKEVSVPVLKLPATIEGLELRTGTDSGV